MQMQIDNRGSCILAQSLNMWLIITALWILGEAYLRTGQSGQAIEAYQKAADHGGAVFLIELAHTYAAIRDVSKARTILDQADENTRPRFALSVAVDLAELRETDQVIASLELAIHERSLWIGWIRKYPTFDSLRSDPRYEDIIQRLNFPEFRGFFDGSLVSNPAT